MNPAPAQVLIDLFLNNHAIIHKQLASISQAESLLQLPFRGNCMNWVVGHIVGIHGDAFELMGLPGTLSPAEEAIYGYGSEPLTDPAKACLLSEMITRLDDALARLTQSLLDLSPEDLEREVRIWRGPMSLYAALAFIQWHEAYHTGQLELLRQLAGKNDKII